MTTCLDSSGGREFKEARAGLVRPARKGRNPAAGGRRARTRRPPSLVRLFAPAADQWSGLPYAVKITSFPSSSSPLKNMSLIPTCWSSVIVTMPAARLVSKSRSDSIAAM